VVGAIKARRRACCGAQMADQFAGQAIDIGPFYSKEFSAREVEDLRAMHQRNVDAFAINAGQRGPFVGASR
jgi:hypothetical protein